MENLTNQEKSARRYEALTRIAEMYSQTSTEFKTFCWNEKKQKFEVTWRKLETYLKQKFESGAKIEIMIQSGAGGD